MYKVKDNLPKTALALYIKLYCKKRGNKMKDKNILIEATKSWLSLNKTDKQIFVKKYDEYHNNFKKAFADYLTSAEPYLKAKKKKEKAGITVIEETSTSQNVANEEIELDIDQNQRVQSNVEINNICNTVPCSSTGDDYNTHTMILENTNNTSNITEVDKFQIEEPTSPKLMILENTNNITEVDKFPIEEPTPPKLISGRHLFEMINENDNNLTWTKLSNTEKRRYQNAVLLIKKKYLMEYKKYLERLSSEKLYHHYKNTNKYNSNNV
ncbi:uncharacterized protein LOC126772139 isoform X1 [Nymphalis io]|uniref:uncharacterized protein LOC126772139 isoform X1 n=1 Tax=Inachis io TaxID=171585 RepID=UPI002166F3C6|nr:uncharacterized protein LOC126772139 isoform X1 [Nymphalis io]XP_050348285.1 uncharacterized protein LOC126772139 isoform X1 [Nymphalis io]XP_050348292.1 uncharacterized protein LOC126772139 isoform X1 [Nymphalis io]